jgi:hypothetical protein
MSLSTIGSIATHVAESFVLPLGISGNMIETVNMSLLDVSNYVGQSIGSNDISETFQSAIVNFSKAQAVQEAFAWATTVATSGGAVIMTSGTSDTDDLRLGELTVKSAAEAQTESLDFLSTLSKETPNQFRQLAMNNLKNIGRQASFVRSLS